VSGRLGRGGPFDAERNVLVIKVPNFQFLRGKRRRLLVEVLNFQFGGTEEGFTRRCGVAEKSRDWGNHERHQGHEGETAPTQLLRSKRRRLLVSEVLIFQIVSDPHSAGNAGCRSGLPVQWRRIGSLAMWGAIMVSCGRSECRWYPCTSAQHTRLNWPRRILVRGKRRALAL
jgi:hypothetical protein